MPAAKANWLPAIQRILVQEKCGCDVYSEGELSIALRAGFEPTSISVNGFPKGEDHIRRAISSGVRLTIDSLEEVQTIEQIARSIGKPAKVRLRLKAPLPRFTRHSEFVSEGLIPTDIAALVYKNGLSLEDIAEIGPRLMKNPSVELVGFHQHNGRHSPLTRFWEEQMKAYARHISEACKILGGFRPLEIDIGGGFAVPRDPFNAATHYSEPLQLAALHLLSKGLRALGAKVRYGVISRLIDLIVNAPNTKRAPTIEQYAEVCTKTLNRELSAQSIDTRGIILQLEPGRSMHGNAGIHLSSVRCIKRLLSPIRWMIVALDTTEFWFTGGRYEHHLHHYLFASKVDAPLTGKADIVGRSCYGDRLLPMVRIPDVQVGDLVALLDTGAYQEVSNSNFNALPRPATVLVRGSDTHLIRQRESEEDVLKRDRIPEHLA
jgi:diaminopimelate decarboxylase